MSGWICTRVPGNSCGRFGDLRPAFAPSIPMPIPRLAAASATVEAGAPTTMMIRSGFFDHARRRWSSPLVGDLVQVVWEGSFNLIEGDLIRTYAGRAWWDAKVLDKRGPDTLKVHYLQWDSGTWDEWVPVTRLRWPAPTDPTAPDRSDPLQPGDRVEVLCISTMGRSPWLEAIVKAVIETGVPTGSATDTSVCYRVGRALDSSDGECLVPRERLRLKSRPERPPRTRRESLSSSLSVTSLASRGSLSTLSTSSLAERLASVVTAIPLPRPPCVPTSRTTLPARGQQRYQQQQHSLRRELESLPATSGAAGTRDVAVAVTPSNTRTPRPRASDTACAVM